MVLRYVRPRNPRRLRRRWSCRYGRGQSGGQVRDDRRVVYAGPRGACPGVNASFKRTAPPHSSAAKSQPESPRSLRELGRRYDAARAARDVADSAAPAPADPEALPDAPPAPEPEPEKVSGANKRRRDDDDEGSDSD